MNIDELFPSRFLKASDLNGRTKTLVIEKVAIEDLAGKGNKDDHKPIMFFKDAEKQLVLNKTNCMTIGAGLGKDTAQWPGKRIELFPTITPFQGRNVDCIRTRIPEFDDDVPL